MKDQVSELMQRASVLPIDERERLVDQLLESLNERATAALDASWNDEIARRLDDHDQGRVHAVGAAETFAKARRAAQ